MKKYILYILFILLKNAAMSQGNPADISQLMAELAKSKPDTGRINLYIRLAVCYINPVRIPDVLDSSALYLEKARELNKVFQVPQFSNRIDLVAARLHVLKNTSEDPRILYLPVIERCRKTADPLTEARAWTFLGLAIQEDPATYDEKITCYQNGLSPSRLARDKNSEHRLLIEIARIHILQNKFDTARRELEQVLQKTPRPGPANTMQAWYNLAFMYISTGESDKALDYSLKIQQLLGTSGDSTSAYKYLRQLTMLYQLLDRNTEYHTWGKIELEYDLVSINHRGVYTSIITLVGLMREERSPAEALDFLRKKLAQQGPTGIYDQRKVQQAFGDIFNDLKQYDLAEKHYLEMIRLGQLQLHRFSITDRGLNNFKMGKFYYNRGAYTKAKYYLDKSLENYRSYGLVPHKRMVHQLLFRTDSALGNYGEAIRHLKAFTSIGDSILRADRSRQIEELQVAYQTVQKDKTIKEWKGKEQVAQLQLRHSQSRQSWIISAAALLLIIATLLYRQGRLRKKSNQLVLAKNTQLEHLVAEKDWLMKEIHHRVKNNLQTVNGLLGTQSAYLKSAEAITAIDDSRRRIQSMSLIHQRLYNSNNISAVRMPEYIHELVDNLRHGFGSRENVQMHLDIAPVELNHAHCIPLGLILNEAITNALKHAFPGQRHGTIHITLKKSASHSLSLTIKDDGIGLPSDLDINRLDSMGMHLMHGLSRELGGRLTISEKNGCQVRLELSQL